MEGAYRNAGAPTRSRLDRAVTARYFFFVILSNLFVFSLLGVFYSAIAEVVVQIGQHQKASVVLNGLKEIPYGRSSSHPAILQMLTSDVEIQGTYVQQSTCKPHDYTRGSR